MLVCYLNSQIFSSSCGSEWSEIKSKSWAQLHTGWCADGLTAVISFKLIKDRRIVEWASVPDSWSLGWPRVEVEMEVEVYAEVDVETEVETEVEVEVEEWRRWSKAVSKTEATLAISICPASTTFTTSSNSPLGTSMPILHFFTWPIFFGFIWPQSC